MSSGRRGPVLSAGFLGLALWLCPADRALAQPPVQLLPGRDPQGGKHSIWQQSLSAEQVRELLARLADESVTEVIICTNPNVEGEATAMYLARLLKPLGLTVTRLVNGKAIDVPVRLEDGVSPNDTLNVRQRFF